VPVPAFKTPNDTKEFTLNTALDYHDFDSAAPDTLSSVTDSEVDIERIPVHQARAAMRPQPSQKPGVSMMNACVDGNREAQAIRDIWRFNHPIKIVPPEEFERMTVRNQVIFHG
jgi:hypothetical protein